MSIIQKIREKGALISAIIIALALLGFIAMDALTGRSSLFGGGPSTTVGKVNGTTISYNEFQRSISSEEQRYQSMGYPSGEGLTQMAIASAWDREVERILVESEIEKLGIRVSNKELDNTILFGNNPPEDLRRQFSDEAGNYNAALASQQINATLKSGTKEQKQGISAYIASLKDARAAEKYTSLLVNSINFPKWFVEQQNADNSQLASISYVRKQYAEISDSSVQVSDKEIQDYINAHKNEFKQEENRAISYVSFSGAPSSADTAEVMRQVALLKPQFETAADADAFVTANSTMQGKAIYAGKSMMQMGFKDSIQKLPVNTVLGPYVEGGNVTLSKMLDVKQLPDSVKCRHILISTDVQQGGFPDSVASAKMDSVIAAVNSGASWGALVTAYNPASDGSRANNGEMTFSSTDIQAENFAPEFGKFILFDGKVGERKKVKTSFGYHYIEIMNFINVEPHYKVAHLVKPIFVSRETDDSARNAASQFAAKSRDEKSFNENYDKELKPLGMNKGVAMEITPSGSNIGNLGVSRALVKKIYDADLGDVLQPERVGNNYVVAVVTLVNKKGTQSVAVARPRVEPLLRNRKKAEAIKKQIGNITTLEAAAGILGKTVERVDSLRIFSNQPTALGYEPKVTGAAFNLANNGKVIAEAIEGTQGVYVVRVENISSTPMGDANITEQRNARYNQSKMQFQQMMMMSNQGQGSNPIVAPLKEAGSIKDNRSKHF